MAQKNRSSKMRGDKTKEFEVVTAPEATKGKYLLRLYLTGSTPKSIDALKNIKRICEENLRGRYVLEVIDIYQQPTLAFDEQIIAIPTLIKVLPIPIRKFIGDLSNDEKVLFGLDLQLKSKRIKKEDEVRSPRDSRSSKMKE